MYNILFQLSIALCLLNLRMDLSMLRAIHGLIQNAS